MTTLEDILNRVSSGIDYAHDIAGIVTTLSPALAQKVLIAEADPTSANVQAVISGYAMEGKVPPADLIAHLLMINEQRHPEDTIRGNVAPFVLGGAALAIWYFTKRRR